MAKKGSQAQLTTPWSGLDIAVVIALSLVLPIAFLIILNLAGNYFSFFKTAYGFLTGNKPLAQSIFYLISVVVELVLLVWVARRYKAGRREFGLRKFKVWQALRLIVIFYGVLFLAVILIFYFLRRFAPEINIDEVQKTGFESASLWWDKLLGFIIIVVLAPVVEEIYFRGFVFGGLIRRFGPYLAAIFSSLIFGLLHFQTNVSIYTFVLALLLCVMYYRCKSIIPGMALHMVNNFIAYLVLFKII